MAFTEKSNWVIVVVAIVTFVAYAAMVMPPALSGPIARVPYEQPIVVTIVLFVVANILGNIVAAASNPAEADKSDQRDREISRSGDRVGNAFILVCSVVAIALAMTKQDYFWIANVLYVGGMVGTFIGAVIKIAAYHTTFQRWWV